MQRWDNIVYTVYKHCLFSVPQKHHIALLCPLRKRCRQTASGPTHNLGPLWRRKRTSNRSRSLSNARRPATRLSSRQFERPLPRPGWRKRNSCDHGRWARLNSERLRYRRRHLVFRCFRWCGVLRLTTCTCIRGWRVHRTRRRPTDYWEPTDRWCRRRISTVPAEELIIWAPLPRTTACSSLSATAAAAVPWRAPRRRTCRATRVAASTWVRAPSTWWRSGTASTSTIRTRRTRRSNTSRSRAASPSCRSRSGWRTSACVRSTRSRSTARSIRSDWSAFRGCRWCARRRLRDTSRRNETRWLHSRATRRCNYSTSGTRNTPTAPTRRSAKKRIWQSDAGSRCRTWRCGWRIEGTVPRPRVNRQPCAATTTSRCSGTKLECATSVAGWTSNKRKQWHTSTVTNRVVKQLYICT